MRDVEITITFTGEDKKKRPHTLRLQTPRSGSPEGEARVVHHLFSELRVAMRDQPTLRHNAVAGRWVQFPKSKIDFSEYFDVHNAQSLWLELSNLVRGIEHSLEMAKAFKELEPVEQPPFEDDVAISNLYFLHDRKMEALDRAVQELIKVQEVVNRLLLESLGGDLVDTRKPDWERTQLIRKNVEKGLEAKRASGALSQSDFDAITEALEIPKNTPHADVAVTYRRRLMHHIHPSVDYPIFFSGLESREGELMKDASGRITGREYRMFARPPVQYRFSSLHASLTEYLDAVVAMLQRLSEIEILRR
jgi:hypothetical protein